MIYFSEIQICVVERFKWMVGNIHCLDGRSCISTLHSPWNNF